MLIDAARAVASFTCDPAVGNSVDRLAEVLDRPGVVQQRLGDRQRQHDLRAVGSAAAARRAPAGAGRRDLRAALGQCRAGGTNQHVDRRLVAGRLDRHEVRRDPVR